LKLCREQPPLLVLADLDSPRLDAVEAIRSLRDETRSDGLLVLGFVSHVNGSRAAGARKAGFDRVVARRGLANELARILPAATREGP
jgi:CheY-like chemotaxis protein